MRQALIPEAVQAAVDQLPGWVFVDDSLKKTYDFKNFREAISFIVRIAFSAEELNHHPELANSYNRVAITLRTHEAGNKVTDRDVELAQAIENISWV